MQLARRQFIRFAAGAAALTAAPRHGEAQNYPARPLRLIVGFAPGGPGDIAARLTAEWISQRLGAPVIVENRPGAGSNLAAAAVVHAAPDGYTLLLAGVSAAINATLYENLNFL